MSQYLRFPVAPGIVGQLMLRQELHDFTAGLLRPWSGPRFLRRPLSSCRRCIRGQTLPLGEVSLKGPQEAGRT